jgi:hypothetical protein
MDSFISVGVIFHVHCTCFSILFFKISMKWDKILSYWSGIEKVFLEDKYALPPTRWTLKKQTKAILIFFMSALMIEHGLFLSSGIYFAYNVMEKCNIEGNLASYFFKGYLSTFFRYFHFNGLTAAYFQYVNFSLTFYWNFMDIFLIVIGNAIAYRFDQINDRMGYFRGRIISDQVWYDLRKHYTKLHELTLFINEHFGFFLIMACLNGSYFILIQLLNITKY